MEVFDADDDDDDDGPKVIEDLTVNVWNVDVPEDMEDVTVLEDNGGLTVDAVGSRDKEGRVTKADIAGPEDMYVVGASVVSV